MSMPSMPSMEIKEKFANVSLPRPSLPKLNIAAPNFHISEKFDVFKDELKKLGKGKEGGENLDESESGSKIGAGGRSGGGQETVDYSPIVELFKQPDQILTTVFAHLEIDKTEVDLCANALVLMLGVTEDNILLGAIATAIDVEMTNPISKYLVFSSFLFSSLVFGPCRTLLSCYSGSNNLLFYCAVTSGTLFRSNSFPSILISSFLKKIGKPYLQQTLKPLSKLYFAPISFPFPLLF
jgi:hypothetical protein